MTQNCPCCNAPLPESGVSFDMSTGDVIVNGERRHVEPQQAVIFGFLAKHPGRSITRAQILDAFTYNRPECEHPSIDLVTVQLCRIRKVLKGSNLRIETLWNGSYRLTGGSVTMLDTSLRDEDLWESLEIANPDAVNMA